MAVNTTLSGLSQTASSNGPDGSVDAPSSFDDAIRYALSFIAQMRDGAHLYVDSISGTNTITGTISTSPTSYVTGQVYRFIAAGANTTAPTLNINSIGAKSITKNGTTALVGGDIPAGAAVEVMYDGTQFQLLNAAMPASVGAPGYQKFPSGLILQWGSFVTSGTADVAVSFATSFASSVYAINLTYTNASGSGNVTTTVGSLTTAGFSAGAYVASSGARASASVYYIAIGK